MNRTNKKSVQGIARSSRAMGNMVGQGTRTGETLMQYRARKSAEDAAAASGPINTPLTGFHGEPWPWARSPAVRHGAARPSAAAELAAWDRLLGEEPLSASRRQPHHETVSVLQPRTEGIVQEKSWAVRKTEIERLMEIPDPRVREVVAMVAHHRDVTVEAALAPGKPTFALQIIVYVLRYGCEYVLSGIARAVCRDMDEVTDMLAQLGERMRREPKLHNAVELVAARLGINLVSEDATSSISRTPVVVPDEALVPSGSAEKSTPLVVEQAAQPVIDDHEEEEPDWAAVMFAPAQLAPRPQKKTAA